MIDAFYMPRRTFLHRVPATLKLACVFVLGSAVFAISDLAILLGLFCVQVGLYAYCRVPANVALQQFKYSALLLAAIFLAQGFMVGWPLAVAVLLRFATLILAASLVAMTTRTMEMIAAFETILSPLRFFGVDVGRVGMTLTLALRFVPVLIQVSQEVREAQRARGLDGNILAMATPVIVRVLRMADDVAAALDARGFAMSAKKPQP